MSAQTAQILLVEDNPDDAVFTLRALKKSRANDHVEHVKDGVEALEYLFHTGNYADRLASDYPNLILLDLKLPKVSGLEVLKQIKADPRTRVIPVVVLTTSRYEKDKVESYSLGVNSYVVKSIDLLEFRKAIEAIAQYWMTVDQLAQQNR